jgi:hypothetical protein
MPLGCGRDALSGIARPGTHQPLIERSFMKINTRAESVSMHDHSSHASEPTSQVKTAQQAGADNNAFRLPQPDPKPEGYGVTVGANADYYPDNKTMKKERMWDADGNQVNYDFDANGKRTHEFDMKLSGEKVRISGPSYDYDADNKQIQVAGARVLY